MGKVFKTAVFGGFRKQEVIGYLDTLSQEKKRDNDRYEAEIALLEKQVEDLKGQLLRAEEARSRTHADMAALKAETEQESARQEALLREQKQQAEAERQALAREKAGVETEKAALLRDKQALSEQNAALSSRVLDFDDERRVFEAEKQRLENEIAEQRRELENRIFDLEAEVLENLEKSVDIRERTGLERARHSIWDLARSLTEGELKSDLAGLGELKGQTEKILTHVRELIARGEATADEADAPGDTAADVPADEAPADEAPEPASPDSAAQKPPVAAPQRRGQPRSIPVRRPGAGSGSKSEGRLGSVKDILRYVRKR